MSKFFAGSSSSSSSGEYSDTSEHDAPQQQYKSRFDMYGDSSSSDEKRVVRSADDKKREEFKKHSDAILEYVNAGNWRKAQSEYDALMKTRKKSRSLIQKMGGTPTTFWRATMVIQRAADGIDKKARKKLPKLEAKALTKLEQTLRKLPGPDKQALAAYIEDPAGADAAEAARLGAAAAAASGSAAAGAGAGAGADGDESGDGDADADAGDGSGDDESGSYYSDSDESKGAWSEDEATKRRNRWMQTESDSDEDDAAAARAKKREERRKRREARKAKKEAEAAARKAAAEAKAAEEVLVAYDVRDVLIEVASQRGRKGVTAEELLGRLEEVLAIAATPQRRVEVLLMITSTLFDVNPTMFSHLPIETWKVVMAHATTILDILDEAPYVIVDPLWEHFCPRTAAEAKSEERKKKDAAKAKAAKAAQTQKKSIYGDKILGDEEEEQVVPAAKETDPEGSVRVQGSLRAFVERLESEFTKSFSGLDAFTDAYVARMRDVGPLLDLAIRIQDKLEHGAHGNPGRTEVDLVMLRRLKHMYYKRPDLWPAEEAATVSAEIEAMCVHLYEADSAKIRQQALLFHVYHLALFNHFYRARDLILMSHIQDVIDSAPAKTQVVYNRAMVQLGLCAFRAGMIQEAHTCLQDICSSGHMKELLAQGVPTARSGASEKDLEKEKQARRLLVPVFQHINLDLLECVHLTTAMLLEVPNMASSEIDSKKGVISKHLRKFYHERGPFTGPPESTRDYVVAAARDLSAGRWREASEKVLSRTCWNLTQNPDETKAMLLLKIKTEGLRTYLFSNAAYYRSVQMLDLVEMFELPESTIHSVVSKMMIAEELHGSWDQPTSSIVMHKSATSKVQKLSLQLAEKAALLVENNEKVLDNRNAVRFGTFERRAGAGGRRRRKGGKKGGRRA